MPFVKGQSGNPGGRQKTPEAFKKHTAAAILRVVELSKCDDRKISLEASKLILAYSLGKPTEHIEHSGSVSVENLLGESRE